MNDLKIGAAYIRVSDERQDEYSPDSQLKKIRECASKDGYVIPDEYVFYDDGISGKSVLKRDDFNRMIALAQEKDLPFKRIYVWKFSRFARNQEQSIVYKNLLSKIGVSVVSVSEPLPEGPFGDLIERIIEWMDEFYLSNLSEEVRRGMTEKASRGEPIGPPPIGYIMKDGQYYPDEESGYADLVREIFRRFADGEGMRTISQSVSKTYNVHIDNRRVKYILTNSCYIGMIRWSPDGTRSVSKRRLDNENIMVTKGTHEPLISMELWESVQKRLEYISTRYPKHSKVDTPTTYMLKGLIKCSSCGSTLTLGVRSGNGQKATLQCCSYARGSCHESHSVTIDKIENAFIKGIETLLCEGMIKIAPKITKKQKSTVDFGKLIAAEEKKLQRVTEAYLDGIESKERYAELKAMIEARIADIQDQEREAAPQPQKSTTEIKESVLEVISLIKSPNASPQAKNEALRSIISHIVYDKKQESLDIIFLPQ